MFHSLVQQCFQEAAKILLFIDNLLPFPTVNEFAKPVNSWRSYCKNSTPRFWDTVYIRWWCESSDRPILYISK